MITQGGRPAAWFLGGVRVLLATLAPSMAIDPTLPPRPPMPTNTPSAPVVTPPAARPEPGHLAIELRLAFAGGSYAGWAGLWTVVQWQDAAGDWHDVDGWRGHLDGLLSGRGKKVWSVYPQHAGRGPFRWAVYAGSGGSFLGASLPFNLPVGPSDIYVVDLTIAP